MAWFGLGRVEFNNDGTIKKSGGGKAKAPKTTTKKGYTPTSSRSAKEERAVKMFLTYTADMKYEYEDASNFLTNREKRAAIRLLNRIIEQLES